MASISHRNLADAVLRVERMNVQERERLAEDIHDRQPNLFFSVLVLHRYEASYAQIEVVLNVMLVFYEAMKCSGGTSPVISEDVQDRCLARVSGRVRFTEGLPPDLQRKAAEDAVSDHPEKLLLAYVFGKFTEHDLISVRTDAEKMLLLAALNLVECIAEVGPRRRR